MSVSPQSTASEGIAVIGLAGRFPGADSVDHLWENLSRGVESIARFSRQELLAEGIPAEVVDDPSYVPAGGALADPDLFAASFFGYSPREALILDPQQRLFLECSWQALETAGYGDPAPHNPVGVFAAVSLSTYLLNRLVNRPDVLDAVVGIETTIGNDKDFLASRVAYKLDLRGPTVVVQSACSSSLVAIHLARQALLLGDCEIALAGGSSIDVPNRAGYLHQPDGIYSSDGHCRPFDARADGMVGGSGVGVVVLKRLDRALADGDTIHAVIRGSAVNNDGANKVGYSAPSVEAQARVVAAAQAAAGVDSSSIGYVEAHGTATALGDPIEVEALSEAFGPLPARSCVLGAVKSNLGHLNAAAGVTGFIKAMLAVRHGRIPPTLHFETPNPHIDLEATPFWINDRAIDWPRSDRPRRAGVSSFGMGGTNAHVVVEEPPSPPPVDRETGPQIVVLSARTESALLSARHRLGDHLRRHPDLDLADVAHTLQLGRKALPRRLALVASDPAELLDALAEESAATSAAAVSSPRIGFLFPGQGAQQPGMAAAATARFPALGEQIAAGCAELGGELGSEIERLLLEPTDETAAAERLEQTALAQPALFLLEICLARLWQSLGVEPGGMLGHSIGEYTAACLAGVFTLSDGVALVRERGRLLQSMPPGAMLAVGSPEAEIRPRLSGGLVIAAVNEPGACVVSGSADAIEALERRLAAEEIATQRLRTSHAFHSPSMKEAAEPLAELFAAIDLSPPEVPFVSNVTGTWITAEEATDPDYWSRHLLQPVRFSRGLETLLTSGVDALLEVGPGTTLTRLAQRHPARRSEQTAVATMAHAKQAGDGARPLLEAAARLWTRGADIEWATLRGGRRRRRVVLPTYPFERRSFWVEPPSDAARQAPAGTASPRRRDPERWCYLPSWRRGGRIGGSLEDTGAPLVVFRPASSAGEALVEEIRSRRAVIEVVPGDAFENLGADRFGLDPRRVDDYRRLADVVGSEHLRVLHLWSLPDESGQSDRRRGFDSLLVLAQGLHPAVTSLDMVCVSAASQEVTGGERVDPWQALILGPCRVVPFERADWRLRAVDLESAADVATAGTGTGLVAELAFADDAPLVAHRGHHRWLPAHADFELPPAAAEPSGLPSGACCLITGGTGGVGAALAAALFDRHQARLALLSRTPLPPREAWPDILSDTDGDPRVRRVVRTVRELEERGARVVTVSADVGEPEALERAVTAVEEELGAIDLVVHAAGVAGGRALDLESLEDVDRALAAKVDGTIHLRRLLGSRATLVLCSSLASEIGGFGQIAYCAANAFQDAVAATGEAAERILTIDWETWAETGMAVDTEVPPELAEARAEGLRFGLTTAEGQALFLRLLGTNERRVLVSTRPIETRLADERKQNPVLAAATDGVAAAAPPELERPDLSTAFEAPRNDVEERLAEIWQRLFAVARVGIHDDFFELGGHSLLATQMLNRLRKVYPEARLALATLFDAPTIAALAARIEAAGETPGETSPPTRHELLELPMAERQQVLADYLGRRLAERPSFDPRRLDTRELAPEIVWDLRRDLDLVVYPHELEEATSLDELAAIVARLAQGVATSHSIAEPDVEADDGAIPEATPAERNPSMVFLLSAPRSGSTLLRLMLAGHSRLFCPPELALLEAASLRRWKRRQRGIFARDGLTRALIELEDLEPRQALAEIERMVEADRSTQDVYGRLQRACGERTLVDKSPAYALSEAALHRAERLFEAPRYLILTRHPVAVIESLVRHRMEALLADGPVDDSWRFAESVWRRANQNLVRLAGEVGERCLRVRYEDLVREPEETMRTIAAFLGLEFDAALLEPYAGGRMIDGPGDPDIFQHETIEAELADAWRSIELPIELQRETVALARQLGYRLETGAPASELAAEEADRLLSHLDDLSDQEVEATLAALLGEQGRETDGD